MAKNFRSITPDKTKQNGTAAKGKLNAVSTIISRRSTLAGDSPRRNARSMIHPQKK
jgi:hypothetical protein